MRKISVVTGAYNEAETVKDVYNEVKKVFTQLERKYDYEHIFMDNSSTDETVPILKDIASGDKRVKILVYSKNFGPIKSAMMGYRYATGDAVITYEGNLKDPPEVIPSFIKYWEQGYDVVYGVREKTRDLFVTSFMRKLFYRIVNALSDETLPLDAGGFRLIDRKIVDELTKLDDYKPYFRGLIASIGFKQIGIKYKRRARPKGTSKSSLGYMIDFAINAVISYSIAPMRLCTYIGLGLSTLSFLAALIYIILKFTVAGAQIPAVAGVIVLILLFSGVQLFFLGVIGEYIGAIHFQVRQKPFVIIKEKINF